MLRTLTLVVLLLSLPAVQAAPSAGQLHVALIGDSLAHGTGDEEGKGLGGRLTPELRSRGIEHVVTTNLGANGATTTEVRAKLQDPQVRQSLSRADAIVLSMGANDLRRALGADRGLRAPVEIAGQVIANIDATVAELHRIHPKARILILGAYAPLPQARAAELLEPFITIWDLMLVMRFADDPLVEIVRMSDLVDRPAKLSRIDSFHPGGAAYQAAAARIATLITRPR